jgi:hypothetical protein
VSILVLPFVAMVLFMFVRPFLRNHGNVIVSYSAQVFAWLVGAETSGNCSEYLNFNIMKRAEYFQTVFCVGNGTPQVMQHTSFEEASDRIVQYLRNTPEGFRNYAAVEKSQADQAGIQSEAKP